jgi:hypothetical protein
VAFDIYTIMCHDIITEKGRKGSFIYLFNVRIKLIGFGLE